MIVIYHWWSQFPCNVWENLFHPIIHAIATLRGHNSSVEIFVLDCSQHDNNWGSFPQVLNFKVEKVSHLIPGIPVSPHHPGHYNLCSRVFSIPNFIKDMKTVVLFSDCDIFWLRDPFPLECSPALFCALKLNSGLWYYHTKSFHAQKFISNWQQTIRKMLTCKKFGERIVHNYLPSRGCYTDEAAIWALDKHSCLTGIPRIENHIILNEFETFDPNAKNMHFLFNLSGPHRGLYSIWIREFYESMKRALPEKAFNLLRQGRTPILSANELTYDKINKMKNYHFLNS